MIDKRFEELEAYELVSESRIDEIGADAVVLRHKKTGARVFVLPCEDENKVFAIGFRTPPCDSTGTPHIIEHTVLCGSEKYPAKDPFIELAKGSLNTFLNAMTYPDKTVYPVASCNEKDFENLMSVYLDAVFHPNIYKEEKIFKQEGWHYELDSSEGELTVNGVVYNEMKGVYSSADSVLERGIMNALYGDMPYSRDSGGDPEAIPKLTYKKYLDFHRKYYHPSNSYIYLYGNADIPRLLSWVDDEYLSKYEAIDIDSAIRMPEERYEVVSDDLEYSITEGESGENASYLSVSWAVDAELDPVKYTAFQILEYLMLDVPGAPVEEALIRAGIGDEIYGGFGAGIRLPYFSINAKNASPDKKGEFLHIIEEVLTEQSEKGIDRDSITAAINVLEFRSREADFGSYSKGLIYGLNSFDSWLYDEDPTMHLRYDGIYGKLRELAGENYFENLIRRYFLNNYYKAIITLNPVKGLTEKKDAALRAKLAVRKASMGKDELDRIIRETKELKAYQSEPSPKEDLLKIPMLKREDISRKEREFRYVLRDIDGCRVVYTDVFTSGIAYVNMYYDLRDLSPDEIKYAAFLGSVLGDVDTKDHSYAQLATLINLNSGGIGFSVEGFTDDKAHRQASLAFKVSSKMLYDKTDFCMGMMREIVRDTKLEDKDRIRELAAEEKSACRDAIQESGHQTALNRAGSHISAARWFMDQIKGISYYKMLEKSSAEELSEKLIAVSRKIFRDENLMINIVCDEDGYSKVAESVRKCAGISAGTDEAAFKSRLIAYEPGDRKEIFTTSAMVNYSARVGNFKNAGFERKGALDVLRVLLNYDYLWNNVRVLGGAYGCSSVFAGDGTVGFTSFRDPKLKETDEVYKGIPKYAAAYEADEREMTKAVIGTISNLDAPVTPSGYGKKAFICYMSNTDYESDQKNREEILDVKPEDIRALAPLLEAVISEDVTCSLAGEAAAAQIKDKDTVIKPLIEENV